jgi:hypothetical protein
MSRDCILCTANPQEGPGRPLCPQCAKALDRFTRKGGFSNYDLIKWSARRARTLALRIHREENLAGRIHVIQQRLAKLEPEIRELAEYARDRDT